MNDDQPKAYLKEWIVDGDHRIRVDLHPDLDVWMRQYDVKVTPLFDRPTSKPGEK